MCGRPEQEEQQAAHEEEGRGDDRPDLPSAGGSHCEQADEGPAHRDPAQHRPGHPALGRGNEGSEWKEDGSDEPNREGCD